MGVVVFAVTQLLDLRAPIATLVGIQIVVGGAAYASLYLVLFRQRAVILKALRR